MHLMENILFGIPFPATWMHSSSCFHHSVFFLVIYAMGNVYCTYPQEHSAFICPKSVILKRKICCFLIIWYQTPF